MAIGDAVALIMGTAETDRQPASGVEEKITQVLKSSAVDAVSVFNGTTERNLITEADNTHNDRADATSTRVNAEGMNLYITNALFLRKPGTTDIISIHGITTNV